VRVKSPIITGFSNSVRIKSPIITGFSNSTWKIKMNVKFHNCLKYKWTHILILFLNIIGCIYSSEY
jgi:hypothetical protein